MSENSNAEPDGPRQRTPALLPGGVEHVGLGTPFIPMKLSEAMRRGTRLRPFDAAVFLDGELGSCAIGAALEGSGILTLKQYNSRGKDWPGCRELAISVWPEAPFEQAEDMAFDGKSREEIADWLESIGQ